MIDLLSIPPDEAEKIAYAGGFPRIAELLGRIVDLEFELEKAHAEIDRLKDQLPYTGDSD